MHAGVTYEGAEFSPSTGAQQTLLNKTHFDSGTCSGSIVPLLEDPALGAEEEEPASLIEYLSSVHSPWHLSESWGPAADQLRELAVRSPALIDTAFILSYFRSLRIVDKGVSEIGEDLLKFVNLDELILSANYITEINSTHLPKTLKVLELCANEISSMKGISCSPPAGLTHLGLGYNKLSSPSEYKYLEASFWPVLLSLDLSFNNLVDLPDLVCKLSSLSRLRTLVLMGNPLALTPSYRGFLVDSLSKLALLDDVRVLPDERHHFKGLAKPVLLSLDLSFNNLVDLPDLVCKLSSLSRLRTLVLMGNPLALTPSYRGFLVDSLLKLALLDDVRVLPDERHHFKGLAKRKELIVDEAKVIVSIRTVQGIPNPVNPVETENPPEYPIVSYSYHVTYEFLNDHPLSTTDEETADQAKKTPTCCDSERTRNSVQSSQQHQESTHEESRNPSAATVPPAGNMTPGPPQNKVPEDASSGKGKAKPDSEPEVVATIKPLSVELKIQLYQWLTAIEALNAAPT
ncbi:UNVERIFIED_CONTAM: hypothetical protein FKN15_011298 [Acipenser sinensis]